MPDAPAPLPPPPGAKGGGARRFGAFVGGCIIAVLLGAGLALTLYGNTKKTASCGAVQLIYLVPIVILLFRKGKGSWAAGFLFGGAIVVLLASMCNDFTMH
jgi:hypothetical protein